MVTKTYKKKFKERVSKIEVYGFIPYLDFISINMTPLILDCLAERLLFKSSLNEWAKTETSLEK